MQKLSGLQLAVMQVLWRKGRASVGDVQESLDPQRPLAYSTLATILKRMEDKGVVRHVVEGRTYIYEPAVDQHQVGHSLLGDLIEQVFAGRPSELVSQLLDSQDIDAEELARIQSLIDQHGKAGTGRKPRRRSP